MPAQLFRSGILRLPRAVQRRELSEQSERLDRSDPDTARRELPLPTRWSHRQSTLNAVIGAMRIALHAGR